MVSYLSICIWLAAVVISTRAIGFRGFTYEGLEEPIIIGKNVRMPSEHNISQPVDHFNIRDKRTWNMRYFENDEFYNGTGPMLVMLGGEWTISPGSLQSGLIYKTAQAHGGLMYYTEHRYYGRSRPVSNTSAENLQYLNVDQALADVAYFIEEKKRTVSGLFNASVIVFGGSYAGNMAAWARLKYPHLIDGALASSAPVHAKADFFEYYEVVASALARYDEKCTDDVKIAFDSVEKLIDSDDSEQLIKETFNLCDNLPGNFTASPLTVGLLLVSLAEQFASKVQYNSYLDEKTSRISILCDRMMNTSLGDPMKRLARIVQSGGCLDVNYDNFVKYYANTTWTSQTTTIRAWLYQTCAEYGYYQTTNSSKSIFGTLFPLKFYTQICTDIYGDYYTEELLHSGISRTNRMYGGTAIDAKNIIFTNGNVDPWHALSVLEDLNVDTPAILINGSSHCQDLGNGYAGEYNAGLVEARARVLSIIDKWLESS